jgi:hypothetical protein
MAMLTPNAMVADHFPRRLERFSSRLNRKGIPIGGDF